MSVSIEQKRHALLQLRLRQREAEQNQRERITPTPRQGRLPCSYQQEGLWVLHQLEPTSSVYHIPFALRLRGELDVDALRTALTALVARHESLRTRFDSRHGVPEQVIDPAPREWSLPVVPVPAAGVAAWVREQSQLPFDLQAGPVFRSSLARVAADEHVLLLVMHHIVADGWSVTVMTGELSAAYNAARTGATVTTVDLEVQPVDHAAWQRRWLTGARLQRQVGYWRDTLEGVPTLDFPTDRPRAAKPTGAGALFSRRLPAELGSALRELARTEQGSFLAVLLAGFVTVLGRYTGARDVAVGSVFSGRTHSEIEPLVGFFANTLVLRTSLAGDPTFQELVRRCNDTVLSATAYSDVPFGLVVEALNPDRAPGRNPLFQVSLTLQAAGVAAFDVALDGLAVTEVDTASETARFDLALAAVEHADGQLDLTVEYSTELFDADRIERLVEHLGVVLAAAVADPGTHIGELEVMTDGERHRMLEEWNPAPVPRAASLLHTLVSERATQAPDRIAMRFGDAELTYGRLDERSNQLAHLLVDAGVAPGHVVAVLLERGLDLPVAELGVLKAGAAWLPLDPQYPVERLAYQLADAEVSWVVTTSDLLDRLPAGIQSTLLDSEVLRGHAITAPTVAVRPEDAAYLIYTSGSTGKPKGVLVPHRAAVNFCLNLVELFSLTPADRVLQLANPSFDVSVSDFFATFTAGATVIGAPRAILFDPDALQALLRDEGVTFGDIPPAVLRLLDPEPLADLRVLFIGMEAFGPELVNRWARPGREFHNGYGPTEVTITCVDYRCPDEPLTAQPPIGRAMGNQRAYVLDRRLRPVPIGVAGELHMAGAGLARGYLGRPDLTARLFLPDPFAPEPGGRMYATGDLVRWRSDGNLEFLGRVDRQVKIRGLRIELGEIEHTVNGFAGVRQCAVTIRGGGTPEAYLAAYVVSESGPGVDGDQLREYLADRLPLHMIPAVVMDLAELPLTANGKLDEARLPAPEPLTPRYSPPETDTQRRLAEIWRGLLTTDIDRIGVRDNFFNLGGNSLQAIQLITRIRDAFGVTLDPRQLFTHPTVEQLATRIDQQQPESEVSEVDAEIAELEARLRLKRAEKAGRTGIVRVSAEQRLPCSYQQEGLWLLHQLDPTSPVYHLPFAMRISGELDVDALRRALTDLVTRHESLRTRFVEDNGLPYQVVDPPPQAWPLPVVALADERDVAGWTQIEACRPFDLRTGPLLRSSLARLDETHHGLMLVLHHIIADGWSVGLLIDELSQLYDAARSGTPATLPELVVRPSDFAAWQRGQSVDGVLDRQLDYWREALAGLRDLEFPIDRPRPAQPTGAGELLRRRLPDGLATAVRELAHREHVTFLSVLLASFMVVLHRYTGQDDLAVGSVFSGRTRSEVEPLVGYFANVLVLRTSVWGDPTFTELVGRCHDTILGAAAHQDVPFGLVVDALKPQRVAGRNPLFQVSFSLQPSSTVDDDFRLGDAKIEPIDIRWERARFDLTVDVLDGPDGTLDLTVEYSTELFEAARLERLIDHFSNVLFDALRSPQAQIDSLDPMSGSELDTILGEWNPQPVPRAGGLLHDLVARGAAGPDRVAMRFAGSDLSYVELERRSSRLAHMLADDFGAAPGRVIAVLLERGLDLPVAQVGVAKTGSAWLPLDPQHPMQRLAYQTADAGVPVVITTSDLADLLPVDLARLCLDDAATMARLAAMPDTAPVLDIRPEDVAYVMYTSGSTGTPKGVMVPHRAAVQYAQSTAELFGITAADRVSQVANPSFDMSVFDFYTAFAAGATVVGAPASTLLDPPALGAFLRDEHVSVSYIPPALLNLVDPALPRDLRVMLVAGEFCPADLANRWSRPGLDFHNGWGPTEVTITCTDYLCPPRLDGPPSIGRPMANQRVYILDRRLRPAPIGITGQLYVAGAGVARGYLGRPDLTAEKFLPDPYATRPGDRMYATGDLGRWGADGNLEFVGRVDRQVKIRGLRIELGEIEHALAGRPDVRQAAVVVNGANTPQARLVGYLVAEHGHEIDPDVVRARLADQLPLYMVPESLVVLAELPLTGNGKLDLGRLPDPESRTATGYVAPETYTARRLAETWAALLGLPTDQVGIHDTFFNLGGNSLQATQLISRIREAFGVTVHPRELFANPTLEQLATRVDGTSAPSTVDASVSALVPIKPEGSRAPLFFVHAVGGSVAPYVALAGLLGADQPFYGLEDPGLRGDDRPRGVPEAAANYLSAIRAVQPVGPYRLGGWSLGGTIALEMAQQLRAGGEDVALVVLLDTGIPTASYEPDQADLLSWFAEDFAGLGAGGDTDLDTGRDTGDVPSFDVASLRHLPPAEQVEAMLAALTSAVGGTEDLGDELRNRLVVFSANSRAFLSYQPGRYDGRLVLLSAADEEAHDLPRWQAVAPGRLEHHVVPGNHFTMLRPPQLRAVADAIRRCLGDAGSNQDGAR